MDEHQLRVLAEKEELDERINSLSDFIDNNHIFKMLDSDEQLRLIDQLRVMLELTEILGERIDAFS